MRKRTHQEQGGMLEEMTVVMLVLISLGIAGLQTTLSALRTQQWVIKQTLADATLGMEAAIAKRYPFNQIEQPDPETGTVRWPTFPAVSRSTIKLGRTSEREVTGTIVRTKREYVDTKTGLISYQLEHYLEFHVFKQPYFKVRKVTRTQ